MEVYNGAARGRNHSTGIELNKLRLPMVEANCVRTSPYGDSPAFFKLLGMTATLWSAAVFRRF